MRATYLFPHVPKTAGAFVIEGFRRMFGDDRVLHFDNQMALDVALSNGLNRSTASNYRLLAGHVDPACLSWIAPPEAGWITVVREPVDRAKSYLSYLKAHALQYERVELEGDPGKSGLLFAESARFTDIVSATEGVGLFVKDSFFNPYALTFARGVLGRCDNVRDVLSDPTSGRSYDLIVSALTHLKQFDYVVEFKSVTPFMLHLASEEGFKPDAVLPGRVNVNDKFPPSDRSQLLELDQADISSALDSLVELDVVLYRLSGELANYWTEQ